MQIQHGRSAPTSFRPELQGLRALAVWLVVVYHVWLGRVSGGVDVFFVISGFLVTGQLARAAQQGGIRYRAMWGRMLRRLLPATATVMVVTAAASILVLPENRWLQTIRELVASALFLENWRLASDSADYFAQRHESSVVQHFWSLSVQGQFYLAWPLLIGLVILVVRTSRWSPQRALRVTLAVVFCCSLAYSIWLTAIDQPLAYFHTLARVWEFALGGLLALLIDSISLSRWIRVMLSWLGVAGLIACGLLVQVGTAFPGYIALWPTLCAVAVLAAGTTGSRWGIDRFLIARPVRYLGDLSFSLYLWHWPVLVLYLVATDQPEPGVVVGVLVIVAALLLAVVSHHLVEVRFRQKPSRIEAPWRDHRLAAAATAAVLLVAAIWQVVSVRKADAYALAVGDPDHPGALALAPGFEYWGSDGAALVPAFVALDREWATTTGLSCVMSSRGSGLEVCRSRPPVPPERRVALVGDSHPTQFLAALRPIAEQRNWQLIVMSRGGCPFSAESDITPGDQSCLAWNAAAVDEILADRPDFVFTGASRDVRVGLTERTPPGYVEQWRKLSQENIPVLAARDNPRFSFSPSACVETRGPEAAECATPREELLASDPPYLDLPDLPSNVEFLDFSDWYCDSASCPPVVGNVLVYMDDNHIGATYMSTMAPMVERAIDDALSSYQARHPSS